jgi:hypothetical protein
VLDRKPVDGKVMLDMGLHGQYRHEHDQPLRVVKFATSGTVAYRVREFGDSQKFLKGISGLFDPFGV